MKDKSASYTITVAIITTVFVVYTFFLFSRTYAEIEKWGQFGDSFGALTSLLTLLAVWGLILQLRREREQLKEELKLQKQLHTEEMEAQKKYHEEEMEEQRKLADGADRPFIMSGDIVKLEPLPNRNYRFTNNLHNSDEWEDNLERAKYAIIVQAMYFQGFVLNCAIHVEITSLKVERTLFEGFSTIGLFSPQCKIATSYGFLWTDFDKSLESDMEAVCKISIYYTNTIGGCFVTSRKSEPKVLFEWKFGETPYDFMFTKKCNTECKQLSKREYESILKAFEDRSICCDCCVLSKEAKVL